MAIRPDLVFSSGGAPKFVADIKYKLTDEGAGGRHADYYQLLAYTTALDLPEGVLIYCLDANHPDDSADSNKDLPAAGSPSRPAAGPSPTEATTVRGPATRTIHVRHTGKVLHTYALDLSGHSRRDQPGTFGLGRLDPGTHHIGRRSRSSGRPAKSCRHLGRTASPTSWD